MSRALILMYHQVDSPANTREQRFCTPPEAFRTQMTWLQRAGFKPVSLEAIVAHLDQRATLPKRAVHITFDDGFIGVLEHALPVLQALDIPATLFALPGRIGGTNVWMQPRGFPRRALLSNQQLCLLATEGMTIGSHTQTHVHLHQIPLQQAQQEIAASKEQLEQLLGQEVAHFAYPYGHFNTEVRDLVAAAGYHSACSTRSGFNRPGEDPFLMRRIDIFGTDKLWQFRQKLHFGTNEATRFQPLTYYARRLTARLGQHH